MRLLLIPLISLTYVFTTAGCGDAEAKRRRGGLSAQEFKEMETVNQNLADIEDAMSASFGLTAQVSEKATQLSQKIQPNCQSKSNQHPGKKFETGWKATQHFEGDGNCPIYYYREWEYRLLNRQVTFTRIFNAKNPEFTKAAGVERFHAGGDLRVTMEKDGSESLTGTITFDQLSLPDYGPISVRIATTQTYRGGRGIQSAAVTLEGRTGWKRSGVVRWDSSDLSKRSYFTDKGPIERDGFLKLFSFFNLDEIVEISDGMR